MIATKYYRPAYLLCCIVFTAFTLSIYATYLQQYIAIRYSLWFELAMVAGQVVFQCLWLQKKTFNGILLYLYHLLTVSLLGSLLLWPLIGLLQFLAIPAIIVLCYFFAVVLFMFLEHRRRVARLSLPAYLSYTWIAYRLLILAFIL